MNNLYEFGYRKFKGVDAGGAALALFEAEYPELFAAATIEHDLFQRYLKNQGTDSVDFIYSNGATIELVHPSFPLVSEICRVAKKGVLLDLSEREQGYPRKYVEQMKSKRFMLEFSDKESRPNDKSHIFVFLSNQSVPSGLPSSSSRN